MNLRALDLNLLVIFDAIFAERSITRAALKVGLSQPATSSALTRLRGHLRDELFLRHPDGLRPTPRAIELADHVHDMLIGLERALDPVRFDPLTARRSFTIAALDYFTVVVAPRLAAHLATQAPGIDFRIVPAEGRFLELLDQGAIDIAAAGGVEAPERFGKAVLVADTYSCLVRRTHALATGPITLARFAAANHVLVSPKGDARGFVDDRLAEHGLTRRIAASVNHFAAAPRLVEMSDLVLTAPTKIVTAYASERTFVFPCPVAVPARFGSLDIIWHERLTRHPAHRWFRETLKGVAAEA